MRSPHGLAIALLGWVSGGATFGSGYGYTKRLVQGHTDTPLLYPSPRAPPRPRAAQRRWPGWRWWTATAWCSR